MSDVFRKRLSLLACACVFCHIIDDGAHAYWANYVLLGIAIAAWPFKEKSDA